MMEIKTAGNETVVKIGSTDPKNLLLDMVRSVRGVYQGVAQSDKDLADDLYNKVITIMIADRERITTVAEGDKIVYVEKDRK